MMKRLRLYSIIFYLLVLMINGAAQDREIIAYFPQWGVEHQPYYVKHIETSGSADKISIINYAFAIPKPDSTGNVICQFMNDYYDYQQIYNTEMSIDGQADDSIQALRGHFNQLKKLKARHPGLKIVVSIGGWLGSVYFSDAALNAESREIFSESCIDIFIRGNLPIKGNAGGIAVAAGIFDGIDIDWEYPIRGGIPEMHHHENDNDNLTKLYALFREKLNKINPELLLTAAVPVGNDPGQIFNIKRDAQYLDWYLLMTYDFHGGWDRQTGRLSNLLTNSNDVKINSMDASVRKFRDDYGVEPAKLIPGAAFYGRSWQNVDSANNGFNQSGVNGPGVYEAGFNYYADIIPLKEKGYQIYWDHLSMSETMYSPQEKIFWTYDETQSIALKARYVDAYNLRGIMFWEISGDGPDGILVNTIYTRNMADVHYEIAGKENAPPTVSIRRPKNNNHIAGGENLIIMVNTNGSDGRVVKVEFFIDDKTIGFDTKSPFSWVWFNTTKGDHQLHVVATDNKGLSSRSEYVQVIVR